MKKILLNTVSLWVVMGLVSSCAKNQEGVEQKAAVQAMARSVFDPNSPVPFSSDLALLSQTSGGSYATDGGYIAPPSTVGTGGEGGYIAGPSTGSGADSGQTGSSSSTGGSSSSETSGSSSTGGSSSSGSTGSTSGTSSGSSASTGGTDGGAIGGVVVPAPGGTDGGSIQPPSTVSGGDTGSVGSGSSGQADAGQTGTTSGGTTDPLETVDAGAVAVDNNGSIINSPSSGGDVAVNTPPATDGGTIPNPGSTNPSSDGGSIGGGTTPTQDGGSVSGGGTTPTQDGGSVSGGGTTPTQDGGSVSGGGTTPTQDGGSVAGGVKPPTQDGGSTTPGGTKPPCGCTPYVKNQLAFQLRRACSVKRSNGTGLFFEEAKNPVLSIEAVNNSSAGETSFWASMGFMGLSSSTDGVISKNGVKAYQVASFPLKGVDLSKGKFSSKVLLAMDKFKKNMGASWFFSYLNIRVCEDGNANGFCFDEPSKNQLAVDFPAFQASDFPRSVQIEVWSGRYLTKGKNPAQCESQYSPLVLDLRGNGLALAGPEAGIRFDVNATGYAIPTGWIGDRDDALLVRDLDDDRRIESGAELFGSATKLSSGERALNGFEALRPLDSDGDGFITYKDKSWADLKLWIDSNKDGVSQRWEMMTLDRAGVESIDLKYVTVLEVDKFGNQTRERSTFVRKVQGQRYVLPVLDVWFNTFIME